MFELVFTIHIALRIKILAKNPDLVQNWQANLHNLWVNSKAFVGL